MKRLLYILLVAVMAFAGPGCYKSNSEVLDLQPQPVSGDGIVGTWELRLSSGGRRPSPVVYAPGNGITITFTKTTYKHAAPGQFGLAGEYTLVPGSFSNGLVNNIPFKIEYNNMLYFNWLSVSGNKLVIYNGPVAADGTTDEYARL